MAKEIERKFLVDHKIWKSVRKPEGEHFRQGYLLTEKSKSIRVRQTPTTAFLTIKGATEGATRSEFEYEIPFDDATELLNQFSIAELTKIRYKIEFEGKLWEVDEFLEENRGLLVAEIELESEDEEFKTPNWIAEEVTKDARYYNANLVQTPFTKWKENN